MSFIKELIERYQRNHNAVLYWTKKGASIGEGTEIYTSANLGSEPYLVTIGKNCRITANVSITTHEGGVIVLRNLYKELSDIDRFGAVTIGNNVHIGPRTLIMPDVHIGSNVIIGCGAIVTKDIPDNSVAIGIPARVIETIDEYKMKHAGDFVHTKGMNPDKKREFLVEHYPKS